LPSSKLGQRNASLMAPPSTITMSATEEDLRVDKVQGYVQEMQKIVDIYSFGPDPNKYEHSF
jgi:hypothetical protein